ncbi:MAG: Arylsulfatase precursor, partial [Verrucomicrobiota bacterium]
MNLRRLMPNHAILAMLVSLSIGVVGLTAPASCESAESCPNVIVIISDDQGYADLGLHNFRKDIKTPNLDQLARGGVLFTDGYVTAPQCSPSRAGMLTGRYQQRFG